MACQLESDSSESSEFFACELCTGVQEASYHCDECLANFCYSCAEFHRQLKLTKKGSHRVESGVCKYDLELELCPDDGQKMSFYCRKCNQRVCPECKIAKNTHCFHEVVSLTQHIGHEKEKLLDKLDEMTSKTETVSYLPHDIKTISTQIELKWLARKELVRQEFASLLETITNQQHQLLADMEQEVAKSLEQLSQLQSDHDALLSTSCQLSDECISAVQSLPRPQFMTQYPHFLDSVKEVENKVDHLQAPEDFMPAFLKVPFSLFTEKRHLHNSLQFSNFNIKKIKAREYHCCIPHDRVHEEMSVNTLLETPCADDLPPSSRMRYKVDIYFGNKLNKRRPKWSSREPVKAADSIINCIGGQQLCPNSMFMVKIQPILVCLSHNGIETVKGRLITVVLVTDCVGEAIPPIPASGHNNNQNNSAGTLQPGFNNKLHTGHNLNNPVMSFPTHTNTGQLSQNQPNYTSGRDWMSRECWKLRVVTASPEDRVFPVVDHSNREQIHCQRRYLSHCSFEEARLVDRALFYI